MIFYRPLPTIQGLTFDLDDTLYDNHPYMIKAEKKLIEFISDTIPCCQDKPLGYWREIKKALLKAHPMLHSDMGQLRMRTLIEGIRRCGLTLSEAETRAKECFDFFYFERSNFTVTDEVRQLLAKLANKVPLVAITNGNVNLAQIGIAEFFQASFHANLKQPMKPDKKMFQMAQTQLSMPASSLLHVGDNLEKDIMGANRAGFNTAWFACNRRMNLSNEDVQVLPNIQLHALNELTQLI